MNYEAEAVKRIASGDFDQALVYAVLSLKQLDRTQQVADAAAYYVRHPDDPEAYPRLAALVQG